MNEPAATFSLYGKSTELKIEIISRLHLVMFSLYALSFLLILLSVGCQVMRHMSWSALHFPNMDPPHFLRAPSVLEIMKIVGFSNIFWGWLYSRQTSRMLGLTYADIVHAIFRFHFLFSIAHAVFTILSIMFAAAGNSESALFAFFAVLIGMVYQWLALYLVVLNSKFCEKLAFFLLDPSHAEFLNGPTEDEILYNLSTTFPERKSKHYAAHLNCFCRLLVHHAKRHSESEDLQELAQDWGHLLSSSQNSNDNLLLRDIYCGLFAVLKEPKVSYKAETYLKKISSSYIISQMMVPKNSRRGKYMQRKFRTLKQNLNTLVYALSVQFEPSSSLHTQREEELYADFIDHIKTDMYILLWVLFQFGEIDLEKKALKELLPTQRSIPNDVQSMVHIIFSPAGKKEEEINNAFLIAKNMLLQSLNDSGE